VHMHRDEMHSTVQYNPGSNVMMYDATS
jgi:hypothetical protein